MIRMAARPTRRARTRRVGRQARTDSKVGGASEADARAARLMMSSFMAGLEIDERGAQFLLGAGVMLAGGADGDVHDGGGFFEGEIVRKDQRHDLVLTAAAPASPQANAVACATLLRGRRHSPPTDRWARRGNRVADGGGVSPSTTRMTPNTQVLKDERPLKAARPPRICT